MPSHRQAAALRILRANGVRCAVYGDHAVVLRHPERGLVVIDLRPTPVTGG